MTKDEIIRLAVQCQLSNGSNSKGIYFQALQSFAKLVAEKAIKEALAQPTPAEYAMGYAEGFEDGCKPKPEHEPIGEAHLMQKGFTHCIWSEFCVPVGTKFYTTPPQRTWVGLTDEERKEIWWSCEQQTPTTFVKAIEQALKEKNV